MRQSLVGRSRNCQYCRLFLALFFIALTTKPGLSAVAGLGYNQEGDLEGASGGLNDLEMVNDAVHAALYAANELPVNPLDVMQSGDGDKLSLSFRTLVSTRCKPKKGMACIVSPDGPSSVGLVRYTFDSPRTELKGGSFQTLLPCQCISKACNVSIAAIPVVVEDEDANESFRTCLYMRQKKRERQIARCFGPFAKYN